MSYLLECLNSLSSICVSYNLRLTFALNLTEVDGSPLNGACNSKNQEIFLHKDLAENKLHLAFVLAHEIYHYYLWTIKKSANSYPSYLRFEKNYQRLEAGEYFSNEDFLQLKTDLKKYENDLIKEEISCNKFAHQFLAKFLLITEENDLLYAQHQTAAELSPMYQLKKELIFIKSQEQNYFKTKKFIIHDKVMSRA